MNDKKETFAVIALIITVVTCACFAGYSIGYFNGQRDAKEGRYRYGYETNITTSANGQVTTNVAWKANGN